MNKLIIWALPLVLGSATAVRAEFLEIQASQIATIQPADKSEAPRVLLQWAIPKDLEGKIIDGATIRMTVLHDGDQPFGIDIHPMTKSWSASSVAWADDWEKAGGDYDQERTSPGVVSDRAAGRVSADVYATVKAQIEGATSNFGFILIGQPDAESKVKAFTANDAARLADARLIIAYRNRR